MKKQIWRVVAMSATLTSAMFAQNQRQATMVGGGSPNGGKCTVEVVVDDAAQVEIRGTTASLRTLSGQPAQWRRFECTGAMPANPGNFRFAGVDGRGRQQLISDPRNGGATVVQIEDKDGGTEGYTFDIFWGAQNGNPNNGPFTGGNQPNYQGDRNNPGQPGNPPNYQGRDRTYPDAPGNPAYRNDEGYRPNYRDTDYYRRYGHAFGTQEAVRVCEQAVLNQATRRFHTKNIHFQRTNLDDRPGRNDWVTGTVDIHRGPRDERYGFACSVNFDNGQVRSAELDPRPLPEDPRWR
jgi:hypothetical protein